MNKQELRQKDIIKLIEGLDISPTMYKNATEKYKAVGTYLQEQGLIFDIFPQGLFSLGTVVRPYKEAKEADYDLDFICCLSEDKEKTTAGYVKNIVKDTLCKSEIYKEKLQNIDGTSVGHWNMLNLQLQLQIKEIKIISGLRAIQGPTKTGLKQ